MKVVGGLIIFNLAEQSVDFVQVAHAVDAELGYLAADGSHWAKVVGDEIIVVNEGVYASKIVAVGFVYWA